MSHESNCEVRRGKGSSRLGLQFLGPRTPFGMLQMTCFIGVTGVIRTSGPAFCTKDALKLTFFALSTILKRFLGTGPQSLEPQIVMTTPLANR